ncbi:MAG: lysophospholipid acyltransferase family protein [Tannerella sp.]|jgi:putative hemolysin|nr:lysophospholipid acyltransferase family protein [Tannerella sp.]
MRKIVFDLQDLREISPVFNNKIIAFWMKRILKWLDFEKVNQIHASHCHVNGAAFTSAMLADPIMDVKYLIHHKERLDSLPQGAFITVSNHPIGSLDGVILIDIFASIRDDFKLMVNEILGKVGALSDTWIQVQPIKGEQTTSNFANTGGVRAALSWLRGGHPIGFFPAGAMSFKNKKKQVRDRPWTHSSIRLIRKANVPVYPVLFDCCNSPFFYWLGKVNWKLRTLRIPAETFNKRGKTFDIYIGQPISPQIIQQYTDDTELADFLYQATYDLK